MKTIRNFAQVIDAHTIIIVLLSILVTWLCRQWGFVIDLPTNLIGIAVIFPLVFSINSAYKRREDALKSYANFRAHAVSIYLAHRDWVKGEQHERRGRGLISDLLTAVAAYFLENKTTIAEAKPIYTLFSNLSISHEQLRQAGVPANEISRINQYLRALIIDFEHMNNIAHYRTPLAIRAYSRIFLNAFPILFGPFFANVAYPEWPVAGYGVAIIYALVLVSLDNIQDDLEKPYDGKGQDDLNLTNVEAFLALVFEEEEL